jgi:hypothetical protein
MRSETTFYIPTSFLVTMPGGSYFQRIYKEHGYAIVDNVLSVYTLDDILRVKKHIKACAPFTPTQPPEGWEKPVAVFSGSWALEI